MVLRHRWLLVHILRNPLDTVASLIEADFLELPSDPTLLAEHYAAQVREGARLGAEHPDRYYVLRYEQLIAAPERTIVELMEWLGERFEPAQLAFNDQAHDKGLEDPKLWGTTEVHSRSVHSWPSRLPPRDAELVWDITEPIWNEFDPDHQFVVPPADPPD